MLILCIYSRIQLGEEKDTVQTEFFHAKTEIAKLKAVNLVAKQG